LGSALKKQKIDAVDSPNNSKAARGERKLSPKSHDLQRQRQYFRVANRNFPLLRHKFCAAMFAVDGFIFAVQLTSN
jgi:hypothetical protein